MGGQPSKTSPSTYRRQPDATVAPASTRLRYTRTNAAVASPSIDFTDSWIERSFDSALTPAQHDLPAFLPLSRIGSSSTTDNSSDDDDTPSDLFSTLSTLSSASTFSSFRPAVRGGGNGQKSADDDFERQIQQCYRALEAGVQAGRVDCYYHYALFLYHGMTPSRQRNYPLAYRCFRLAVQEQRKTIPPPQQKQLWADTIAHAQYNLGEMLANGKGVERDVAKALKFFQSSAKIGHAGAQYEVAMHQMSSSADQAQQWLHKAAAQGHVQSQVALGKLLLSHKHEEEAIRWLSLAATEHENKEAVLQLIHFYDRTTPEKALALCTQFLVTHPDDNDIHYHVGIYWFLHGDHTRAATHLERALAPAADDDCRARRAHRALGRIAADAGDHSKAHKHYLQAASMGDMLALGLLGHQFEHGIGCPRDLEKAVDYYSKAATDGGDSNDRMTSQVPAQVALGMLLYKLKKTHEAIGCFEKVVAHHPIGNSDADNSQQQQQQACKLRSYTIQAQYMVAMCGLQHGDTTCKRARALETLEMLAEEHTCVNACIALAEYHQADDGKRALHYLRRAADLGDADAQFHVAQHMHPNDHAQAYVWYCSAAASGHPMAQLNEALYHLGHSQLPPTASRSLSHAEMLLRRAAAAGVSESMRHLALLDSTPHDQAIQWLQKAAAHDNTNAMRELALRYAQDPSTKKSALGWMQKAAALNDALAWHHLGQCYAHGSWGLTKNVDKATKCMNRAEALGHIEAGFDLASLYENDSEWDLAIQQYTSLILQHSGSRALKALLGKCRLVILHSAGDNALQQETMALLTDEVKQSEDTEAVIEPLEFLGVCHEYGYATQASITDATEYYTKATRIQLDDTSTALLRWAQERTRCRLATVLVAQRKFTEALDELHKLEPYLDQMRGHQQSSETVTQAREARFLLGYLLLRQGKSQQGMRWLQDAAEQGHTQAIYELGKHAIRKGKDAQARSYFRKGDVLGHAGCKRELALLMLTHGDDDNEDYRDLLETAADMGDAEAMFQCGVLQQFCDSDPPGNHHLDKATQLYLRAAAHGHPTACVYAGYTYYLLQCNEQAMECFSLFADHWIARFVTAASGLETSDPACRDAWLDKATCAVPIDPSSLKTTAQAQERRIWCEACEYIGRCYETVMHDRARALEWYIRSADLAQTKYIPPMLRLAQLAQQSSASSSGEADALEWYRRAADCGDAEANYQVGRFHQRGCGGLEVNLVVAAAYFRDAQAKGHVGAIYALANVYWELKDYQRGWACYKNAADRHAHVDALRALGFLYMRGLPPVQDYRGCPFSITQNHDLAMAYFSKAARRNDETSIMLIGSYLEHTFETNDNDRSASLERLDKALAFYDKAYTHKINNPVLEFVIGRLHQRKGNSASCPEQAEPHYKEAYRWFQLAAKQPQTRDLARVTIAYFHLYGWDPAQHNPQLGFRQLLQIELETQDMEIVRQVKMHVAQCYQEGIGVDQDPATALAYWKQLCALGVKDALHAVEDLHAGGLASQQDVDDAREILQVDDHIEAQTTISTSSSYS